MTPVARTSLLCAAIVLSAGCRQATPEPEPGPAPAPAVEPATQETDVAATSDDLVPLAFFCSGNEPFWALGINGGGAVFETPDSQSVITGELGATGSGAFRFRGTADDSPALQVDALMSPGQCFDTMADGPAMPFIAVASFADVAEASGCCSVEYGLDLALAPESRATGKAEDDWSRYLPDLAAGIDRCVHDAGVATHEVTLATPMNRGKASVRLRDSINDRYDCLIDLGSNRIESIDQVAAEDRMPIEGNPLLLPAGETPPILSCGRVERVLRDDGSLLGYLHYVDGCD